MLQALFWASMKQIEHVLKRVRVVGKEGEFKRLSERQFAVARAIAERTIDGDRGCQLPLSKLPLARSNGEAQSKLRLASWKRSE